MKFDLIPEEERKDILDNIRKAFPKGAKDASDFKIMFNVMRGFLVIKGTQHIDEQAEKGEDEHAEQGEDEHEDRGAEFERPKGDRRDQNYHGKKRKKKRPPTPEPEQEE